jgi:gliding motility-associated-like protein
VLVSLVEPVAAQPSANFSVNISQGCAPLIVQFTDQSTGSPTSWSWDFGNGNVSSLQNPGVVYTNPGIYTVRLIAGNGSGDDTITKTAFITVFAPPSANFSASVTSGCVPLEVSFQDQTTPGSGAITSWFWDFGDGNFSTKRNPTHTYTTGGVYTIYLKVVDANNCQSVFFVNDYIRVGNPVVTIEGDSTSCPESAPVFLKASTTTLDPPVTVIQWYVGGAIVGYNAAHFHTFGSKGLHKATVYFWDNVGCVDSAHHFVRIMDLNADFDPVISSVDCANGTFTVDFNDNSNPASQGQVWAFGDGDSSFASSPSHKYDTGTYAITYIPSVGGQCTDTITKILSYYTPIAKYSQDLIASCSWPVNVTFTNQSTGTGLSYLWEFGDGNSSTLKDPSNLYTAQGEYDIKLTVTDSLGCIVTETSTMVVQKPEALFMGTPPRKGCIPISVSFTDLSTAVEGIVAWKWYFGDGDSSSLQNPTQLYDSAGTYDVTLIITTVNGCKDTVELVEYVRAGIKPDFTNFNRFPVDTICFGQVVSFTDSSGFFDTTYKVNEWCWSFHYGSYWKTALPLLYEECPNPGDDIFRVTNRTATIQNPTHIYDEFKPIFNDTIVGTDTFCSYSGIGLFGDDSIRLIAGYNGCYDTTVRPIYVQAPMAMTGFKIDQCAALDLASCSSPAEFGFFNSSDSFDVFNFHYIINEGTGDTLANLGVSDTLDITITTAGNYGIHIGVTNTATGCMNEQYRQLTIDSVVEGFTSVPQSACIESNVFEFEDTTVSFYGTPTEWKWIFGDGDTIIGLNENVPLDTADGISYGTYPNPTHIYLDTGTFVVYSRVRVEVPYKLSGPFDSDLSNKICYYESYDTITVHGVVSKYGADTTIGCPGLSVNFTDSSASTSTITSWNWDFGDATTSTTPSPSHVFALPGVYDVSLYTEDANGCRDTATFNQLVAITQPTANFTISDTSICPNETITFSNQSSGAGVSYVWDFGDATTDSSVSPSHEYTTAGTYTVTLTATDSNGCVDVLPHPATVTVNPDPIAGFTQDTMNIDCPPYAVRFTDTSTGTIQSWHWDFGDNGISVLQNPVHVYTKSGAFDVTLSLTTIHGCVDTAKAPGIINIGGPSGTFTFEPDSGCIPMDVTFKAIAQNAAHYIWDFGDGDVLVLPDSMGGDSVFHTYDIAGVHTPNLSLQDTNFCTYIVQSLLNVHVDEVNASFTAGDTFHCGLGPVSFDDLSTSFFEVSGWTWDFGDGDTDTTQNPSHTFDSSGTYTIILEAGSVLGCTGSDTFELSVIEEPAMAMNISDTGGCVPLFVQFDVGSNSSDTFESFSWNLGEGTSSTLPNPSTTYTSPGSYLVNFSGEYASGRCTLDTVVRINVYKKAHADFIFDPHDAALNNATISFFDRSANATFWNWDFGDTSTSTARNPQHLYTDHGAFVVTLVVNNSGNCPDTIQQVVVIAKEAYIKVPNAFTPNGDGLNDVFRILRAGVLELIVFRIYNRWGELVFETFDIDEGWDGKFRGNDQDVGTFVYYVQAITVDSNPESVIQKGSFSLLR